MKNIELEPVMIVFEPFSSFSLRWSVETTGLSQSSHSPVWINQTFLMRSQMFISDFWVSLCVFVIWCKMLPWWSAPPPCSVSYATHSIDPYTPGRKPKATAHKTQADSSTRGEYGFSQKLEVFQQDCNEEHFPPVMHLICESVDAERKKTQKI